jgi:hypothetical protein
VLNVTDCVKLLLKTLGKIDQRIHTLEKGVSARKADTQLAIKELQGLKSFIYNYEDKEGAK